MKHQLDAPTTIAAVLVAAAVGFLVLDRLLPHRHPLVIHERRVYSAWTNMTHSSLPYEDWSVLYATKLLTPSHER